MRPGTLVLFLLSLRPAPGARRVPERLLINPHVRDGGVCKTVTPRVGLQWRIVPSSRARFARSHVLRGIERISTGSGKTMMTTTDFRAQLQWLVHASRDIACTEGGEERKKNRKSVYEFRRPGLRRYDNLFLPISGNGYFSTDTQFLIRIRRSEIREQMTVIRYRMNNICFNNSAMPRKTR